MPGLVPQDIGKLTEFMLTLVENPDRMDAFRKDRAAAVKQAGLSPALSGLLTKRPSATAGDSVIVVIIVVVVV